MKVEVAELENQRSYIDTSARYGKVITWATTIFDLH